MFERLKHLTDEVRSHLPGVAHEHKPDGMSDQCLAELRMAAQARFPKRPAWHEVKYEHQLVVPVHIIPLPPTLPASVDAEIARLKTEMLADGVLHSHVRLHSQYEELQAHIWVATPCADCHRPIGILIFNKELRAGGDAPVAGSASVAGQWWLSFTWLSPLHRHRHIFCNSMPYIREWHPGFLVHGPTPELRKALKDCPDCICDPLVSWA